MAISVSKILGKLGIQPKAKEQKTNKPISAPKEEKQLEKTLGALETAGRAMVQKPAPKTEQPKIEEPLDPIAEAIKQQREFEAELQKKFGIIPASEIEANTDKLKAQAQADIDALNAVLGETEYVISPETENKINQELAKIRQEQK